MKTILITGASGLIGSAVTESLLSKKYTVIGTDKRQNDNVGKDNYNFVQCNITDKDKIGNIFKNTKIDILIHLACSCDNDFPAIIESNEISDAKAVDKYIYKLAVDSGVKDILLLSTTQVYAPQKSREPVRETYDEKPSTNYAKLKYDSEKALANAIKKSSVKGIVMRVPHIYTRDYSQNLHDKVYDYKENVAFLYKEGEYTFCLCCLYNLVDFISGMCSQESGNYQGIYNVCDTRNISARAIVDFEREAHRITAVVQRNYTTDAVKSAIALNGKKAKTDYRYLDLATLTENNQFDNTKATRISTFRWKLENTK